MEKICALALSIDGFYGGEEEDGKFVFLHKKFLESIIDIIVQITGLNFTYTLW